MTRRLFAAFAAVLSVGVAVAAPVPKVPPPPSPKASATVTLATAKVNGQFLQITGSVTIMETVMQQEVTIRNGQQVIVAVPVTLSRHVLQTYQMVLKGTKATTADGKEISEEDLAKKLGDGGAVVQVNGALDPEWKKVFADDIIFLESNNVGVKPGFGIAPGGGAVIRPLPIRPIIRPALPPIEELPVEKPVEKKDEQKEPKKEEKE